MNKWNRIDTILTCFAIIPILIVLGVQFFTGGNPINIVILLLYITSSFCLQALALDVIKWKYVKILPLIVALIIATRGIFFYNTSSSWMNATLEDLIVDYISPFIGCIIALCVSKFKKKKS